MLAIAEVFSIFKSRSACPPGLSITLSLTELHRAGTKASVATTGIVLAVAANTLVKAAIAALLGGRGLGVRVLLSMLAVLAAGGAGLLVGVLAS